MQWACYYPNSLKLILALCDKSREKELHRNIRSKFIEEHLPVRVAWIYSCRLSWEMGYCPMKAMILLHLMKIIIRKIYIFRFFLFNDIFYHWGFPYLELLCTLPFLTSFKKSMLGGSYPYESSYSYLTYYNTIT